MIGLASSRQETQESRALVEHAFALARATSIKKFMVQAGAIQDIRAVQEHRAENTVIWLTEGDGGSLPHTADGDPVVSVPAVPLTRMSQIHMGVLLAVMRNHVAPDETMLCLSGIAGSQRLDTMVLANARRDYPWFRGVGGRMPHERLATRAFARALEIALRFAGEGREGRPIGTIFAIGDVSQIAPHVRQLILNPCAGHDPRLRNIHRPGCMETMRELAALDGGFVISPDGLVEHAGAYFDAPAVGVELQPGLGARHAAAAALSAVTDAVTIVVSESSHAVTVFDDGGSVLVLEQPSRTTESPVTERSAR